MMTNTNQVNTLIKKKLMELLAEASVKFEELPNILFNGAYEVAGISLNFCVETDEEGKVMCEFKLVE